MKRKTDKKKIEEKKNTWGHDKRIVGGSKWEGFGGYEAKDL